MLGVGQRLVAHVPVLTGIWEPRSSEQRWGIQRESTPMLPFSNNKRREEARQGKLYSTPSTCWAWDSSSFDAVILDCHGVGVDTFAFFLPVSKVLKI